MELSQSPCKQAYMVNLVLVMRTPAVIHLSTMLAPSNSMHGAAPN